jgi:hypothetical protein
MFLKIISEEIWDIESGLKAGIMMAIQKSAWEAFRSSRLFSGNHAPMISLLPRRKVSATRTFISQHTSLHAGWPRP